MTSAGVRVSALPGSAGQRASRLAPEIHDMILANIRDSTTELANCSLVCNLWLHLCRYYLFNEVNFRHDFAQLLSTSPHARLTIAPYIRKAEVKGGHISQGEKEFLLASAFQLPSLKSLHVEGLSWEDMKPASELASASSSFSQLSNLSLKHVVFASLNTLLDFFDSLSSLEVLSLQNLSWDTLESGPAEEIGFTKGHMTPSSLKRLHLSSCHNFAFLNWLLHGTISDSLIEDCGDSHRQFPFLVALSLPDIMPAEAKLFKLFLTSIGSTLEHLEFGMVGKSGDDRGVGDVSPHLALTTNSNLKTLVIHQITLFYFPSLVRHDAHASSTSTYSPYSWIPSLISTIQSSDIHSIGFRMWFSSETQLDMFPWADLSSALLKVEVPIIRFHVSGIGRDTHLVEQWITTRLEDIDKQTIKFDFLG